MAHHIDTGKTGELLAAAYLQQHGYMILHTNWRHSHYEIDIIATRNDCLHFIEIKTRRSSSHGLPEESVSLKKVRSLMKASAVFLYRHPGWKRVQHDVLSITLEDEKKPEYFFIEDVSL